MNRSRRNQIFIGWGLFFLCVLLGNFGGNRLLAQAPGEDVAATGSALPLVYKEEHTGAGFAAPTMPGLQELPFMGPLPDPFAWSDGSGRSTEFADWKRRRAEIKAEIEHYGIGEKPPRPDKLSATFDGKLLTVSMSQGESSLTLTAQVSLPEGEGPFPAVIGIGFGGGTGSLPPDIFKQRDIATIAFNFRQVMAHQQKRGEEPINRLFPDRTEIGAYSAWSWGISRLIDGLELTQEELPIDRNHLGVTGCSFAGKMALFAGALDERIALTIAQESGGGGAAAWRVSETLGNVETLGKTSRAWFREDMFQFSTAVERLPYDHHELMAMIAPRALLVLGNPDYEWLADESGYVSCRAAHAVWETFGIRDRFGFSIVGGHPHCRLPASQRPEVEAFVDKFMLGQTDANTHVTKHPFNWVEHEFWYDGWAKGQSTFPTPNSQDIETLTFEAESMERGSDWEVAEDDNASSGKYVIVKPTLDSPNLAPTGQNAALSMKFTTTKDAKYTIYARVNCPSADDDSFWVQVDGGEFQSANGLQTQGWQWAKLTTLRPSPGKHTLTIKYRENGASLDCIGITTYPFGAEVLENVESPASLKKAVGARFKIGVGVGHRVLKNPEDTKLIQSHFQILTPENCMKPQGIHPGETAWRFEESDEFANFVRQNDLEMVGHCLVWAKDDRTDAWMMSENGTPVSREKLLERIEHHVETVVSRYADVAAHWDVVNEAIGDSNEGMLRDSVYSRTSGIDFIVTAFKTARAYDPDALLIYNDYNGHKPGKREKLIEFLKVLQQAGAPVDAYGMQGHFELGDNSLSELRATFEELRKLDIQVVVSELDIDVVKRGRWWAEGGKFRDELKTFDPYQDGMPAEIEQQMVKQYVELFKLFDEYQDIIARVSFWNLHDGQSWLNYFPWQRVNHPLLFDRQRQAKPAFDAVYELLKRSPPVPTPET